MVRGVLAGGYHREVSRCCPCSSSLLLPRCKQPPRLIPSPKGNFQPLAAPSPSDTTCSHPLNQRAQTLAGRLEHLKQNPSSKHCSPYAYPQPPLETSLGARPNVPSHLPRSLVCLGYPRLCVCLQGGCSASCRSLWWSRASLLHCSWLPEPLSGHPSCLQALPSLQSQLRRASSALPRTAANDRSSLEMELITSSYCLIVSGLGEACALWSGAP